MTFRDQLRDWLGGLWSDFWNVSPRRFWSVAPLLAFALSEAFWRIGGELNSAWHTAYHAWFPIRIGATLALMWFVRRASSR